MRITSVNGGLKDTAQFIIISWVAASSSTLSYSSNVPWTMVILPSDWRAVSSSVDRKKAVMSILGYSLRNTVRNAPVRLLASKRRALTNRDSIRTSSLPRST